MKRIHKLSIMALLTIFLFSFSVGSASAANYMQWEQEPNNSFETANRLISYNIDQALNRGYLSSNNDVDYWTFDYGTAANYQVAIQVPTNDYYYVIMYHKVGDVYYYDSVNFGGYGDNIYFTVPGLSSDGVVPQYYFAISTATSTVTPDEYYQIVVDPI